MANTFYRAYRKHARHTSRGASLVTHCQACGHRVRGKSLINPLYIRICSFCNRSLNG